MARVKDLMLLCSLLFSGVFIVPRCSYELLQVEISFSEQNSAASNRYRTTFFVGEAACRSS